MSEQEPSNATLLAKLEGLDTFMRLSVTHLQQQIEPLTNLPSRVATLEARQEALASDLREVKEDREGGRNRILQWIAILSASLVGIGLIVVGIIQLVGHA